MWAFSRHSIHVSRPNISLTLQNRHWQSCSAHLLWKNRNLYSVRVILLNCYQKLPNPMQSINCRSTSPSEHFPYSTSLTLWRTRIQQLWTSQSDSIGCLELHHHSPHLRHGSKLSKILSVVLRNLNHATFQWHKGIPRHSDAFENISITKQGWRSTFLKWLSS